MTTRSARPILLPSFWVAQLGGWGLYAAAKLATRRSPSDDVVGILAYVLGGMLCTIPLRYAYREVRRREPRLPQVVVAVLLGSALATLLWMLLHDGYLGWKGAPFIVDSATFVKSFLGRAPLLVAWSALYFAMTHWQDLERERARTLVALADAKEAQLQMLRYQLQPHFLFNALNSLRALIAEDPARAREMVTLLSGFLRYSLLPSSLTQVTLAEEVESVRQYLAIEQIRFEERLAVQLTVSDAAAGWRVPSFLLHPLIENAVKHGWDAGGGTMRLALDAREQPDGSLTIEVTNTGRWAAPNDTGLGIANVRARLTHAFPGHHDLELGEQDGLVRARVRIQRTPAA